MGLLDHYRQYEGMSDEEVSAQLRAEAEERRRRALARIDPLDLSGTAWFEPPHPDVVAAIAYHARRAFNRYADPRASELRREIAQRHGIEPQRIAIGNGAAELLSAAVLALLEPGDELVTHWPSYPLYPLIARRARGRAVPAAGYDVDALLGALTGRTRVVAVCNPNDPTGAHLPVSELRRLLEHLPGRVTVLLDEALVHFVTAEEPDASLELLDDFERLIVFRTFSKAYGLAGLRCGYALGGPGSDPLLERLEPPLGVGTLAQMGALEALRECGPQVAARREAVAAERDRLARALAELPVDAPRSQANFVWLTAPGLDGSELAERLERQKVVVQPGGPFGASDHVRAAVQSPQATDRLLDALRTALA